MDGNTAIGIVMIVACFFVILLMCDFAGPRGGWDD